MACFIVPATEAVVVTAVNKLTKKKNETPQNTETVETGGVKKIAFSEKVKWLQNMLWGGSALLAFEHLWHGEITPWFPFLTAAESSADLAEMAREMSTVGVSMTALVTAVWGLMLVGANVIEKRALVLQKAEKIK